MGGREKNFTALVLLFAASAAIASPTIISDSPARIIPSSTDHAAGVVTCDPRSNEVCGQISEFAGAIFRPPSGSQITVASGNQRCLPALPSAIAMVLTGFICISLIQDRRAWVAVLAGILWVGQTGIWALPELTSRLSRRVHSGQQVNTALAASYPLGGGYYPDSYSEEIRYIGLLHHLAGIPQDSNSAFTNSRVSLTRLCRSVQSTTGFSSNGKDTRASQDATVLGQFVLSKPLNCLVSGTRQFICFSPALIFCRMPRGPPISQMRPFYKTVLGV